MQQADAIRRVDERHRAMSATEPRPGHQSPDTISEVAARQHVLSQATRVGHAGKWKGGIKSSKDVQAQPAKSSRGRMGGCPLLRFLGPTNIAARRE
jgi:hypothetical protein